MKKIVVLGAGKSASVLIESLCKQADERVISLHVADLHHSAAQKAVEKFNLVTTSGMDLFNEESMLNLISGAFAVVSLLPAHLHPDVAKICLKTESHLITASYISAEMNTLSEEAASKNLLFLNECGLDPGIDHISAMQLFKEIRADGGKVISFKSWCGGLVSEASNDNPWGYKISWNPRNVVNAGKGTARFRAGGINKYLPYHRIFQECWQIEAPGIGQFEGYANRDSLGYTTHFGLEEADTLIRGTLRIPPYCRAWNILVQLGMTDDSFGLQLPQNPVWADFTKAFLPNEYAHLLPKDAIKALLGSEVADEEALGLLEWMGLFSDEALEGAEGARPADLLLSLMEEKWLLKVGDTDRVVMIHEIEYLTAHGLNKQVVSSLDISGVQGGATAMATTVGLPLYLGVQWLITGKPHPVGVQMPTWDAFIPYALESLEKEGIRFTETWS